MAKLYEMDEAAYQEWLETRPPNVRKVAARFRPNILYRMKSTGQRVTTYSFGEHADGSVALTVSVTADFNLLPFERNVFGISPDDLEECDLPGPMEPVGITVAPEDVDDYIKEQRRLMASRN